jgi:hypothetical protein
MTAKGLTAFRGAAGIRLDRMPFAGLSHTRRENVTVSLSGAITCGSAADVDVRRRRVAAQLSDGADQNMYV